MIKLEQLRYLLELNKTDSFRQCAELLQCSQPAVSQAIKNLENELGVELFERTGNSVYLTETGKQVAKKAREILGEVADIYFLAKGEQTEAVDMVKEVAFYAPETTLSSILPTVLLKLQKENKQIKYSAHESNPENTLVALSDNSDAIGLHYFWEDELASIQQHHSDIVVKPLCELQYYLVTTEEATFDVASEIDLDNAEAAVSTAFPLVLYGRSSNITWDVMDQLVDHHNAELVFKAPEEKLFFNYVHQGLAAGLIMQYGHTKPLKRREDRECYRFIPLTTERKSYFCWLSHKNTHQEFYKRVFDYVQFSTDFL